MYILHYIVAMLTFKCFLKAEGTTSTDIAFNKPVYTSWSTTHRVASPSHAVDAEPLSCCMVIHLVLPVWVLVDLGRAFHFGRIYLSLVIQMPFTQEQDHLEDMYLLLKNEFDNTTHAPNPRKDTVCHIFDKSVTTYDGNMTCVRRRNQPPHRYIAFWMASFRDVKLCTIKVFEGCGYGFFGPECSKKCYCKDGVTCDPDLGKCPDGCMDGYKGESCDEVDMGSIEIGCEAEDSGNLEDRDACRDRCYSLDKDMFTYDGAICNCSNFNGADETEMCDGSQYQMFSVCPKGYFAYQCTAKCACRCDSYCGFADGRCTKVDCGGGTQDTLRVSSGNSNWMTLMPLVLVVMMTGFILL